MANKRDLDKEYLEKKITAKEYMKLHMAELDAKEKKVEKTYTEIEKTADLVAKCVQQDDIQMAEDAYQTYLSKEEQEKAQLIKDAESDYIQAVAEMTEKMKRHIAKGLSHENAQMQVFLDNPELYAAYNRAYNILVTRG